MKVDIRDAKAVSSLRPSEVVAYLRAKAWRPQRTNELLSLWTRGEGGEQFEVAVPMDTSLRDFALRMGDLLQTLAVAEQRSQAEIFSDLQTTFADVVRIRIDDPELADGTLPIEVYAQVGQKARDLLLAAACSALQTKAVWHTRKPVQAVEQVRKMRIGQSERGSYVVTLVSRVSPELHSATPAQTETEPPYERRVTQMLATALASLDRASAEAALSQNIQSFEDSVAQGVSANLCDAVAGLWGDDDRNRNLEFTFSWSPARPVESSVPSRVRFKPDSIPFIREASRVLKERSPFEEFELEGAVVRLERAEGQTEGKVTVMGNVEGKPHRVSVELEDADYRQAIQAHDQAQPFHCVGTLVKEGRGYQLRDARDISVVSD